MKIYHLIMAGLAAAVLFGCNPKTEDKTVEETTETEEMTIYVADLAGLNSEVTGTDTMGKAEFTVKDDNVHVVIEVRNSPANMEHWQHFHGFVDGAEASCVTMEQDANGDGILDVTETESVSGTTMVPFNKIPAAMNLPDSTYPVSDGEGHYRYEVDIPLDQLESAFADAFDGQDIALDSRVLYIHGVPADQELPETVASIADIPAQVTIPIACGKITKVQ